MKKAIFFILITLIGTTTYAQYQTYQTSEMILTYTTDGYGVLIHSGRFMTTDVVIPDEINYTPVTYISPEVFRGNDVIKTVTLPIGISEIVPYSFGNCKALEYIDAPGVEKIYEYAFSGCMSLRRVVTKDITDVGDCAFMGCKKFSTIDFNQNGFTVGDYAFAGTKLNGSLHFNVSLSTFKIGAHAFEGTDISSVYLRVGSIGEYAFANCKELKSFEYNGAGSIQAHAFEGSGLTSLSMDNYVSVEEFAFANCKSLKEIEINQAWDKPENYIETNAFAGCNGLTKTTIRNVGYYTIKPGAFTGCTGTLYLASNISQYGTGNESPFSGSNFKEVFIQGSCKKLPAHLLCNMLELIGVSISKDVTSIETPLAYNCPNFETYYTFETGGTYYAVNGYLTTGTTDNRKLVEVPSGKRSILLSNSLTSINQDALKNSYSAVIDARNLKNIPAVDGKALIANKLLVAPGMKQKMLTYAEEHPFRTTIIQNQNMYATCDIIETAPTPLADVNCDESVNGADVVAIYNYIVNGK